MKAGVLYGPRDMRVEELPVPGTSGDEILVRMEACGICGSDLHLYRTGGFEDMGAPMGEGRIMGHEFGGEVMVVGEKVEGVKVGDRVAALAMGGFAEMVLIPKAVVGRNVFHLPEEMSYREAATLEPLAASVHTVAVANPAPGDTVVILGAGIIGLSCIQVLKAKHHCRIIVTDFSEKRLGLARRFGADDVIPAEGRDTVEDVLGLVGEQHPAFLGFGLRSGKVDTVIDCAGSASSTAQALRMVRRDTGKVVLVALFERESTLDLNYITRKEIRVKGSWGWSPEEFGQALEMVARGAVDRIPLISHRFPLEKIRDAFEAQTEPQGSVKVLVESAR